MPPLLPGNQGTSSSRHIGAVITLEATELCNPGTVSSASHPSPTQVTLGEELSG